MNLSVEMTHISDYFSQFIILNKINIDYKSCSYAKRNFSNFDEQSFKDGFKKQDMSFLENTNLSMNSKFDLFYEKVSTCVDFHAPVKKMNKKYLKLREKPWIILIQKYKDL